eukprot:gene10713-biopygen6307
MQFQAADPVKLAVYIYTALYTDVRCPSAQFTWHPYPIRFGVPAAPAASDGLLAAVPAAHRARNPTRGNDIPHSHDNAGVMQRVWHACRSVAGANVVVRGTL